MARNVIKPARGLRSNIISKHNNAVLGDYEIVYATDTKEIGIAYFDTQDNNAKKITWFKDSVYTADTYLTEADVGSLINTALGSVMTYKGNVANLAALNALTDMKNGDFYNVLDTGYNYAWNASEGTWDQVSGLTVYTEFVGASASLDGEEGLVTKPLKADRTKFLKGDGTWATPDNDNTTALTWGPGLDTSGTNKVSFLSKESADITAAKYTELKAGTNVSFNINTAGEATINAVDNDTVDITWGKGTATSGTNKLQFLSRESGKITEAKYTELKAGTNVSFSINTAGEATINATDTVELTKTKGTGTTATAKAEKIQFLSNESTAINTMKYTELKAGDNISLDVDTAGEVKIVATDTTYSVFTGATASVDGTEGLVKKPLKADRTKFLKGDGTWADVPDADTRNTAGATNKASTKLFLIGAEGQTANPVTNSNANVYIGTNNKLYSQGKEVFAAYDTKEAGIFYSGNTTPTNTVRLNYDGYLHATKLYSENFLTLHESSVIDGGSLD